MSSSDSTVLRWWLGWGGAFHMTTRMTYTWFALFLFMCRLLVGDWLQKVRIIFIVIIINLADICILKFYFFERFLDGSQIVGTGISYIVMWNNIVYKLDFMVSGLGQVIDEFFVLSTNCSLLPVQELQHLFKIVRVLFQGHHGLQAGRNT